MLRSVVFISVLLVSCASAACPSTATYWLAHAVYPGLYCNTTVAGYYAVKAASCDYCNAADVNRISTTYSPDNPSAHLTTYSYLQYFCAPALADGYNQYRHSVVINTTASNAIVSVSNRTLYANFTTGKCYRGTDVALNNLWAIEWGIDTANSFMYLGQGVDYNTLLNKAQVVKREVSSATCAGGEAATVMVSQKVDRAFRCQAMTKTFCNADGVYQYQTCTSADCLTGCGASADAPVCQAETVVYPYGYTSDCVGNGTDSAGVRSLHGGSAMGPWALVCGAAALLMAMLLA